MDTTVIVLIVVVVVLLVALVAVGLMLTRRRRSEQLQDHYGPEYQRTLKETGDRRSAEAQLTEREKRIRSLDIRDLNHEERERYAASWVDVQQGFVDDPVRSVQRADALVTDIMKTRGFPVEDVERRAEDISVEHPKVVERYREARTIHDATVAGRADTELQRRAVASYRELIDALLGHDSDRDGTDRHGTDRDDVNGRHHRTDGADVVDDRRDVRADPRAAEDGYSEQPYRPTEESAR